MDPNIFERTNMLGKTLDEKTYKKLVQLVYESTTHPTPFLLKIIAVYVSLYYYIYMYLIVHKKKTKKSALGYVLLASLIFGLIFYFVLPNSFRINTVHFIYKFWWAHLIVIGGVYYQLIYRY